MEDAAHYAGGTEVKDEVRSHICSWTGLTPSTSAPGLGSPHPHLHRDWAHPSHICSGTGLISLPHLRRDSQVDPDIEEDVTQATKTITISQRVEVP